MTDFPEDFAGGAGTPRALVFDSRLGGLTVLAEIRRLRPDVNVVSVADDGRFPLRHAERGSARFAR